MKNLFLLLLFLGIFVGIQIALLKSNNQEEININYEKIISSVVQIEATDFRGAKTFGSGVIVSEDGYIITAYHLLLNGQSVSVKLNGNLIVQVIGFDQFSDIAVVKIENDNLRPIDLSQPQNIEIGAKDFAMKSL